MSQGTIGDEHDLVDGMFDDAAPFPPGNAPMVAAPRTGPADRAARARAVSTSFGTGSVADPVGDLVGLGPLPASDRIPG